MINKMQYNRSLANNQRIQYLWILVMLSLTFPIFNQIPVFKLHYLFWTLSFGLAFIYSRSYFKTKAFIWLIIYTILVCLNKMAGDNYFNDWMKILNEFLEFFIPITMVYYIFKSKDKAYFDFFMVIFGIFLIECTIASFIANSIFPGIMRLQSNAVSIEMNRSILTPFQQLGMSNYAMPHAIPVIIPGLVYKVLNSKGWIKLFFAVVLLSAWFLSYVSGSFMAMVFSTFSLIFSLLVCRESVKKSFNRLFIIGVIVLPILMSNTLQLTLLHEVKSLFPDESIAYGKINDIEESIYYGDAEGGVESRQIVYQKTLDAIMNNIISGTNAELGGHSAILDRLASLGFVGFIPYVLFIIFQVKYTLHYIYGPKRFYYYVGLLFAVLMMGSKSMSNWSMWFFSLFILPSILYCDEKILKIKM